MLKISFNFDETTNTVSNVTVTTGGSKIVTTSNPNDVESIGPDLEVLENKLQLSKAALVKLNAKADDRISIQYINTGIGKAQPLIAKAEMFTDRLDGNRLTQKGTVSFRGEKRSTLIEFGTIFTLEQYKDGIWKLIPIDFTESDNLIDETEDMENLNKSEVESEIEEIMSSADNDDLPF